MQIGDSGLRTILLADDDSEDREFFQDALNDIAVNVILKTAENGIEALNVLHQDAHLPDLIFLDLNMPLMNGHECLNDIKQDERLKDIPVIIFSTSVQPETANEVYDCGASLYVVKPNSFPALKGLLKKLLAPNRQIPLTTLKENFIFKT
jgi:CheY-like chemotaxis protein